MPVPGWVNVLIVAEQFGIPPWELTDENPPKKVRWYIRKKALNDAQAHAQG